MTTQPSMMKFVGLALSLSTCMLAQIAGTGSISGVVQDESGAVVVGADVTITNVGTGISSMFMTDSTGGYHVPGLIPGQYEVRAQKSGFETGVRQGLQLTVGSDLSINIVLKVGQTTQQTVVTGEAPLVDTANSTLSGLVDEKTIRDLPLNGRSFDQLISLDSSAPTFRSRGRATVYAESDQYTVNGHGAQANLFLIDGTEMQGAGSATQLPGGVLGINLGVDAIQEFSLLTSNYSAVYGKKAGAIVNIATRSGTNDFHGTAFEFLRNSFFDARNFYDGQIPAFRRNEFGGALGGPIKKDNSFFFVNYEGLTLNEGLSKVVTVPDANAHQGLLPCKSAPTLPCGSNGLANVGIVPSVLPYLNSGLFPLPNGQSFGDGTAAYASNPVETQNQGFLVARFDQRISDKDSFFARYNYDQANITAPDTSEESNQFNQVSYDRDQDATVEEKRLFSPTTINVIRAGFGRAYITNNSAPVATLPSSLYFLPGSIQVGQITFSANGNAVAGQGITRVGPANAAPRDYAVTQYEEADQFFHYVGPHALQFGVQIQRNDANDNAGIGAVNGTYTFTSLQNFLQGVPSQFSGALPSAYDPHKSFRRTFFSTYAQDDYKVTRNFTLNLGLRYELLTVPTDATNRLSNFRYTYNSAGILVLNSSPTLGSPLFQGNHLNFAPRIGFAWDPFSNGKTSLRGGFGTFYNEDLESNHFYLATNAPFAKSFSVTNPAFPNALAGTLTSPLPAADTLDPAWQTATTVQWNISLQRQITANEMFSVAYLGAHSYHLGRTWNANTDVPEFLLNGQVYPYDIPGSTVFYPAGQPRLQPGLSGTSRFISTDANAFYNALQADFTQRLKYGLRARVSFTYSKALDTGPGSIASYATGELGVTENRYDPKGDWGLSAFNLKFNTVVNFTYDIPSRAKSGFTGKVFGGWQLGGIITAHPGTPFTVTTGFSQSRDGDNTVPDRPSLMPGVNGVPILGGPNRYFDSSVFTLPQPGFFGNVGRNTLIGPGFADLDSTLVKSTAINERMRIDFRAEFFNLLNHANFALPSSVIFQSNGAYLGSAGHISSTLTTSRQIQLGIKLIF